MGTVPCIDQKTHGRLMFTNSHAIKQKDRETNETDKLTICKQIFDLWLFPTEAKMEHFSSTGRIIKNRFYVFFK